MMILLVAMFLLTGCSDHAELDVSGIKDSPEDMTEETFLETENEEREKDKTQDQTETSDGSSFSVRFLDVGQADAALIECDGHFMLIDGGNKEDSSLVFSALKKHGVKKLDILIGTHAHEDHIGGIPGALVSAPADVTFCPVTEHDSKAFDDFAMYALLRGGGISVPVIGDELKLGSARVIILGLNAGEDVNDTSIITKVIYGDTSFLFAGDAERAGEEAVLSAGADLTATVLKVGHHGSGNASTYPFLREVMPEYAVISVGEGNEYGHPHDSALGRLKDVGARILRTDLQGDILMISDGKNVSVAVENDSTEEEIMTPGEEPECAVKTPETGENGVKVCSYVLNRKSLKFHHPDCESVAEMSEKNKIYFDGIREELTAQGYEPCGGCRP